MREKFDGFPNSGLATAMPNLFFARVLPEIEAVEELVVTTYFFFAAGQAQRTPRSLTMRDLEADAALVQTLGRLAEGDALESLHRGIDLAVRRGSIFEASTRDQASSIPSVGRASNPTDRIFAVNTPANRAALASLTPDSLQKTEPLPPADPHTAPDIFTLYEQNIGAITPLIADDLKDAEERYPPDWVRSAIREAAEANKRSWRYIASILRRWESEGPDYEKPARDPEREWLARRYSSGKRGSRTTA